MEVGGEAFRTLLQGRDNTKKCHLHNLGKEDKLSLHKRGSFTPLLLLYPFPCFTFSPTQPLHITPVSPNIYYFFHFKVEMQMLMLVIFRDGILYLCQHTCR